MPGNYDANITIGAQLDTEQAAKGVAGLTGKLDDAMAKGAGQADQSAAAMQTSLSALSVAAGSLLAKVGEAAAGMLTKVVDTGLTFNRQMENYQLAFDNLLGSAEAANAALDAIKADAAATPFDVAGLVSANRLLISTGQSAEEARQVINALGNAVSASGGGNDELQRMAANLQQIANVGEAAAIDVKQFAYAGIDIYGLLADYTGKTREEVQDLTITYDLLAEALKAASAEGGRYAGAMEAYSRTLQGRMDTLADNATQTLGLVTEGVHNAMSAIVGDLAVTLDEFTAGVDWDAWSLEVQGAVTGAYNVVKALVTFLLANGKEAISLITGVASAFAAWKIVSSAGAAVTTLTAAIASAGGLTAALGGLVSAINPVTAVLSVLAGAFTVAYTESEVFRDTVNAAVKGMYDYCSGLLAELSGAVANLWSTVTTGSNKNDIRNDPEWLAAQAERGNAQAGQQLQKVQRRSQAAALQSQADADREVDWAAVEAYNAEKAASAATSYAAALDTAAAASGKAAKQTETLADKLDDAHSALTGSQSAYDTLAAAVEEYSATGGITVATWQQLMALAPEYQALLTEEGGKLRINEEAYASLSAAQRQQIEALAMQNGAAAETIALYDKLLAKTGQAAVTYDSLKDSLDSTTEALDTQASVAALEFELWEAAAGEAAGETERLERQLAALTEQQNAQRQVVEAAKSAYDAACDAYGANSDEALRLYEVLLQEQIAFEQLRGEVDQTTAALTESRDALTQYWAAAQESLAAASEVSNGITALGSAIADVEALAGVDSGLGSFLTSIGGGVGSVLTLADSVLNLGSAMANLGQVVAPAAAKAIIGLLGAFDTLVPGLELASGATAIFNAVLNANPIILAITLVAALAAALIGLGSTNTAIGEKIRTTWYGIVDTYRTVFRVLGRLMELFMESQFFLWNMFVRLIGHHIGLKEVHFDYTSWIDDVPTRAELAAQQQQQQAKTAEDYVSEASAGLDTEQYASAWRANTAALDTNTAALEENAELLRSPPRYRAPSTGVTTGVQDYAGMLAAAQAAIALQGTRVAVNYDAASAATRLNASWRGTSTTIIEMDGREVARAVTPYVDENLAF